jgi:hypothetical protein
MRPPAVPNFFVVGTPKAGTTSLYRYLAQHPQVFMSPIKEPCFFAPEVAEFTPAARAHFAADRAALRTYLDGPMSEPRSHGLVLEWKDYLKLFKNVRDELAIGEVSGNYLASSAAPLAIRTRIPEARIVMILRDPVDRLYSQYVAARGTGESMTAFVPWVSAHLAQEDQRDPPFGVVWTGRYARHLRRYLDVFPEDQVRVFLYDDYQHTPLPVLRALLAFLHVDPCAPMDVSQRHNVTRVPRWPALHARVAPNARRILGNILPAEVARAFREWYFAQPRRHPTPAERRQVIEIYEDDIRALERLIGRALPAWLSASGPAGMADAAPPA